MSKVIISPSILSSDFANLGRDILNIEEAGADWVHVDVMDGHFVPNLTIGVPVVKSIRKVTKLPFDVHLMIENPKDYVKQFAEAGADWITFHYEAVEESNIKELADYIKSFGVKAGISIKPKTKPEVLKDFVKYFDLVLVMTVEPGFGGQKFMEDCALKIPVIKSFSQGNIVIQVDGGINQDTAKVCTELGANSLVAGSYVFKSEDLKKAISSLR